MDASFTTPTPVTYHGPVWLQKLAQLVSYVLHPLFVPAMVSWLVLYAHPIHVLLTDSPIRLRIFAMVLINTVLFPGIVMLLLKALRFIPNMYLHTRKDRIIPLTISIIFYFWAYYVGRNLEAIPPALHQWLLGVFLASCAAMFCNIFFKISLHTIAAGGALMFFVWQMQTDMHWPLWWLLPLSLAAGMVGSARLLRNAHTPPEVYAGYLAGALCQVAAAFIVG
jgi:hypothetical protein